MPTYEMPIIVRTLRRDDCAQVLKSVAMAIFEHGGFIRKIENWGHRDLPYKIKAHGTHHTDANHYFFKFDVKPSALEALDFAYRQNQNIIRTLIFKYQPKEPFECTIGEEMRPAPYRKEVQALLKIAKRTERKPTVFKHNTGLDYYPF